MGNLNDLETNGAATDGFYPDVPSGCSISRVITGVDNDLLNDWEILSDPSPAARGPLYDSDGDGLLDGEEMKCGYPGGDNHETFPLNIYYTQPRNPDTDGDSLEDGPEVYTYGTSPVDPDSDFDGYFDNLEVRYGTNPTLASSRPGVVINEVYYDHPGSDDRMEYITLFNREEYDVDISYFQVESAGTAFKRDLTFPGNTIIPAGCFFLIGEEDAVDIYGNPPDFISWLDLQNGDQNDADVYNYGAGSPTDGVRLIGPKTKGGASVIDTVLWNSPNDNKLPGDANDPAQSDEFISDILPGFALRRKQTGYDTDNRIDWKESVPLKVASTSGIDPGRAGDIPVHFDYTGDGNADVAVFRYRAGLWGMRASPGFTWEDRRPVR